MSIVIYTKDYCPYCIYAKQLLQSKNIIYKEIRIDLDPSQAEIMKQRSGRRTVPQIFIDDQPIGGYDDLVKLDRAGKLDTYCYKNGEQNG